MNEWREVARVRWYRTSCSLIEQSPTWKHNGVGGCRGGRNNVMDGDGGGGGGGNDNDDGCADEDDVDDDTPSFCFGSDGGTASPSFPYL
jgi:hypothetical protein